MAQRKLDKQLEAAVTKALRRTSLYLDARFTEEISAVKWDFPSPPQVRDIVDTGRLRASQTREQNSDGTVTFTWPVEYATEVHEGGVGLNGQRFPGRPWTKAPLEELPAKFGQYLKAAIEEQR
ncbi:MAG: hypothetical protein ACO395_08595 [Pontimonas sp.]